MAQRLATEYVKTSLKLSEAELEKFTRLFEEASCLFHVKVFDNGTQEFAVHDDEGDQVIFTFDRNDGLHATVDTCRIRSSKLANAMRKAISLFKGDAIVRRIYSTFTMLYTYEQGSVRKIEEFKAGQTTLIFEHKDTLGQLEKLFRTRQVEEEIHRIHGEINYLLDQRNHAGKDVGLLSFIDQQLARFTHKLFVLEA